jgi:hypothetical protein
MSAGPLSIATTTFSSGYALIEAPQRTRRGKRTIECRRKTGLSQTRRDPTMAARRIPRSTRPLLRRCRRDRNYAKVWVGPPVSRDCKLAARRASSGAASHRVQREVTSSPRSGDTTMTVDTRLRSFLRYPRPPRFGVRAEGGRRLFAIVHKPSFVYPAAASSE